MSDEELKIKGFAGNANQTTLVLCARARSAALPTSVTACTIRTSNALLLEFIAWKTPLIIIVIPEMIAVMPMILNAGMPMVSIKIRRFLF